MKPVFGVVEAILDILYMILGTLIGIFLIVSSSGNPVRLLSAIMALVLIGGDSFHLLPRINLIKTGKEEELKRKLGRGKQVTSITMTLFYVFLWHIGLLAFSLNNMTIWTCILYSLALIRIILCLLPQNKWDDRYPPVLWGIRRNIPLLLQGAMVAGLYFIYRGSTAGLRLMWLAIVLSFLFYIPVVLGVNKNPKLGMLMLPKTYSYLWMLLMCLSL